MNLAGYMAPYLPEQPCQHRPTFAHSSMTIILAVLLLQVVALACRTTMEPVNDKGTGFAQPTHPTIYIDSKPTVPLLPDLHTACAIDIFFGKGMTPRNILSNEYIAFVRRLGFRSLQYSGGSTADHDHVIIGDTLVQGGAGDGYNIRAEDVAARGEDIQTILDGVGVYRFGKDFFNEYCALLRRLNIVGDVIANVQTGTLEELFWKIERARAQRVIFGMEQNLASNAHVFTDGHTYRKKVTPWIQAVQDRYPQVRCVVDAAPIFHQRPRAQMWNAQLQGMPGHEVRLYLWDKDLASWTDQWSMNQKRMSEVFSQRIPSWIERLRQTFPDKTVAVCQWGLKPQTPMYNTLGACLYVGRFYQFLLNYNRTHANPITYACFMSLKSLNRGHGAEPVHGKALALCGQLFSQSGHVLHAEIKGANGVEVAGVRHGNKMMLLVVNPTDQLYSFIDIYVDKKPVAAKDFMVESLHGPNPMAAQVFESRERTSQIVIKPYAVHVIAF